MLTVSPVFKPNTQNDIFLSDEKFMNAHYLKSEQDMNGPTEALISTNVSTG